MNTFAYCRVSTKDQNLERQLLSIEPYEIPKNNVFCDYQSGKDFERPAYQKMLRKLKKGDLLIVKSIDRLGRNYNDILVQWQYITKEIKADILVLDMSLLDTRKKNDDLTGTLIADLVLQILAYVAQTEREFIKQRQKEGIKIAKANGVVFGRMPIPIPEDFNELKAMYLDKKISCRKAAQKLGVCHKTFLKWCQK